MRQIAGAIVSLGAAALFIACPFVKDVGFGQLLALIGLGYAIVALGLLLAGIVLRGPSPKKP